VTFAAAATYLLGTINETASRRLPARLERMRAFLHRLGDPQNAYPSFHVGGTSGKGSTATMIAAALSASGRRVGLHTKPHLSSMVERARIDGIPIGEERFAGVLEEMMPAIEATARDDGRPTYYETLLALTFLYFAREAVDVAVIEVGIGGMLDGTNVLIPVVSVITNVGLDHTDVLGETIEEIAADKAGIAKFGVPLVTDAKEPALSVIERKARESGAPLVRVESHTNVAVKDGTPYGQALAFETMSARYDLELPVLGTFQRRNAATAITALELAPATLRPSAAEIERGWARLVIPARMECFPGYPSVVFDIAHNPDKAASLAESLQEEFPGRRFTFVVAIGESKDAAGVLDAFFLLPASFVFTTFSAVGRTPSSPQRLVRMAQARGLSARAIVDPVEALSVARREGEGSKVVVVTGSTFLVGTLRDWWFSNVLTTAAR